MPDIKLHLTIKSVYSLQKTFVYLSWLNSTVVGTMLALACRAATNDYFDNRLVGRLLFRLID